MRRVRGCGLAALAVLCCVLAALWLIIGALFDEPIETGNTPEEMFRAVVLDPIPPDVTQLEAGGYTWQGYYLWIRFEADPATAATIVANYEPADCDEVLAELKEWDESPIWRPQEVTAPRCYLLPEVSNTWTGSGTHYLLIDDATGTVYFSGIGG